MPDRIPAGVGCPQCFREDKGDQMLYTMLGSFGAKCDSGHEFKDTETLLAARPRTMKIKTAPRPPDPGTVGVTFQMPAKVRDALMVRFGEKLGPTAVFIFSCLLEPGSFVVGEADADRLKQHIGQEVPNATKLVGHVYSLKQTINDLRSRLETAETRKQGNGKGLNLDLPLECVVKLAEKAKFSGQSMDEVAAEIIETGLKNGWV